ncbi:MAG: alpha/beta hydrolase [Pseudomonadales bacterium]|nr:alpha/beta hydrolase [Pseudomonadales bacterium]
MKLRLLFVCCAMNLMASSGLCSAEVMDDDNYVREIKQGSAVADIKNNKSNTIVNESMVLLWPDGAPQAKGTAITDQPALTIHLPKAELANGTAVVINPGGGFSKLASDSEGLHVAQWLNSFGVAAFVVRYRLRPNYEPSVALLDAKRALRYVRDSAEKFGIDPDRIGVMGFSAGGRLAAAVAIGSDEGDPTASDPIDRVGSRPDFSVLLYPVVPEELIELVSPSSPATFFALTHEDRTVSPKQALPLYEALLDNGVQAEMHILGRGAHGTGMALGDPGLGQWPALLAQWLRTRGFLTSVERIPVTGTVSIDGEPLYWGGITLIPEDPNAPIVWTHARGEFNIDVANGPVPGPHRVEVNILSRDMSDMASGRYSMESIEHYTKASPDASGPLMVEITADKEIQISIVSK